MVLINQLAPDGNGTIDGGTNIDNKIKQRECVTVGIFCLQKVYCDLCSAIKL